MKTPEQLKQEYQLSESEVLAQAIILIENFIEPKIVEAVKDYKNHVGLTTSRSKFTIGSRLPASILDYDTMKSSLAAFIVYVHNGALRRHLNRITLRRIAVGFFCQLRRTVVRPFTTMYKIA